MTGLAYAEPIIPGHYADVFGNAITVTDRTRDGRYAVAQAATPDDPYVLSGHTIRSMYPFRLADALAAVAYTFVAVRSVER
jgi:hypothetical protein